MKRPLMTKAQARHAIRCTGTGGRYEVLADGIDPGEFGDADLCVVVQSYPLARALVRALRAYVTEGEA